MTILDEILVHKREEVARAMRALPASELAARAREAGDAPRGFRAALARGPRPRIVAEIKRRSPSRGEIRADFDPQACAQAYAEAGAAAISVLTDERWFGGSLDTLSLVRRSAPLPILRKDFIVDPYQVLEARAYGASGVLLIVRMVPHERLLALMDCAAELGLFVLLEAFSAGDLKAAAAVAREREGREEQVLLGLNCRDLETLDIDFGRFSQLRGRMPPAWPCVAESGVQTPEDAARVAALGYRLALVGTSLMRRVDAKQAVRELVAAGRAARH